MKRIFSILLALSLLCGCSAEKSKFELPYFSKNAIISCRNFEYDCNISYSKEGVTIDVLSTAAKGLSIYYNGNEISFINSPFLSKTFKKPAVSSSLEQYT